MNYRLLSKYLLLFGGAVMLVYICHTMLSKLREKKNITQRTAQLPSFVFRTIEGRTFTPQNLSNRPTWLIYFHSDCEFCQKQLDAINAKKNELNSLQIILVSPENVPTVERLKHTFNLEPNHDIVFVRDTTRQCYTLLGMTSTPYSLLYGVNGKLIRKQVGLVEPSIILKNINE